MKKSGNKKAFTLIELLTVIAIIAMLIAMFGVGMQKVKIIQKNLQQKAELKSMEVGLHLFASDFEEFPDSQQVVSGTTITGAQRLTEVLLGRDEMGFHPRSKWHPALEDPANPLYDIPANDTTKQRKPEYSELKECGLYRVDELWAAPAPIETATPVITDVFRRNKDTVIGDKTGMPVLYFKANPSGRFRVDKNRNPINPVTNDPASVYQNWVYNFRDNYPIIQLPWLRDTVNEPDGLAKHYQADPDNPSTTNNAQVFYEMLTQREEPAANIYKPYNRDTFILISAGYDGVYGTKDDITNFNY